MSDQFEKKIQESLQKLTIPPSESVWDGIAQQLDENKKKRRFLWWIFFLTPLLLILSIGLFNVINQSPKARIGSDVPISMEEKSDAENRLPSPVHSEEKKETSFIRKADTPTQEETHKKNPSATSIVVGRKKTEKKERLKYIEGKKTWSRIDRHTRSISVPAERSGMKQNFRLSIKRDTSSPSLLDLSDNFSPEDKKDLSKWNFGVSLSSGFSFISNPLFPGLAPPTSPPIYNDPAPGGGGPDPIPSPWRSEPKYAIGMAYQVGFQVKRWIGEDWWLVSGINFRYSSAPQQTTVHLPNNSPTFEERVTNHFDFIEIPILFNYRSSIGKIKVTWEGGFSFSHLISAQAFQYDGTQFYKENKLLHKTPFSIQGGVAIRLLNSEHFLGEAGPFYQYSLSEMAKENVFSQKHLNHFGIKFGFSLKK